MPLNTRHSRRDHHLIKACAADHRISERTARQWRAADDPRWRDWLTSRIRQENFLPANGAPHAGVEPMTPEEEERAAAVRLAALQRMIDAAIARGDSAAATSLLRSAEAGAKLLNACRAAKTEHDLRTGKLVDAWSVKTTVSAIISAVSEVCKRLPDEFAHRVNPSNPALAYEELNTWLEFRLSPAVQIAEKEAEKMPDGVPPEEAKS